MPSPTASLPSSPSTVATPRLGFVGVGWIGRHRMNALLDSGCATAAALADPDSDSLEAAVQDAPEATCVTSMDALLTCDLDGVVIATPSALHAEQAIRALEAGLPVFCQKPLGRTVDETRRVIEAARRADRLLAVDLSYRHVRGIPQMRSLVQRGALGDIYAAELTFHNAYGPDKPWFYDPEQSGGGCVIDLGIHLVDLALWILEAPGVEHVTSRLMADGRPLDSDGKQVEDYATARLDLAEGTSVDLSCSWNLPTGKEAVIEAAFYGTDGGVALRNIDGSFYDFCVEHFEGTSREVMAEPPDAWGGRAVCAWADQLSESPRYDPAIEHVLPVAETLDAIYGR